jgi:23S rRNA pseudouridine1911/1915/1917 synthase
MSSREVRNLSIPEGLNQERLDAALSRLLGLSRNVIVGLIESGEISNTVNQLANLIEWLLEI